MTWHDWVMVSLFYLTFEAGSWTEKWQQRRAQRKANAAQGIKSELPFNWACPVRHCPVSFSSNDFKILSKLQKNHLESHGKAMQDQDRV